MLALFVTYCYNSYIILNIYGNEYPLVSSLFTMIIILFAFFILYHKDELEEDRGNYFKKINFINKYNI